jgi:hypothetical protein
VKRAPFEPGREWRTVNAIHRKKLTMREKSLLIAVAKHESRRNRVCHASISTLAADVGCDVKTARFALHDLSQKKIIRIKNVRGLSSRIVIDWKRFAKLPPATPPESGRGASRRGPLPKVVGVPLPNPVAVTPPESGTTQRVKNQGSESGAVSSVFENNSGEILSHHHPPQAQTLCSPNGDRLDDFKKIVLAKCKDPDGMLSIALDVIVERTRRSGINVTSPKYLEVALDRFNFQEGQDREDWTALSRGRAK